MTSSTWPVLESDLGKSAVKWREMKLCTPQVAWHSKDPVYSVDFHCLRGFEWRLASAGTDKDVKIWKIIKQDGKVKLEFMSHLSRHCKPVNVVRFSPNGSMLASGSDDGTICLWVYCEDGQSGTTTFGEEDMVNREVWHVSKTLRGHLEDVYDVCWSPSSTFLLSCSFDESVIVWDVCKGAKLKIFRDSKQPSQGVCWDPRGDYFATLSRDRCLRIYSSQLMKLVTSTSKIVLPSSSSTTTPDGGTHKAKMYHDEGLRSFFRRLSYSPDGSLLITPAGFIYNEDTKHCNTTFVFSRENYDRPLLHLPVAMPTVAVRTCPILFELRELANGGSPLVDLPYAMVFAVASMDSVYLYNTQQHTPFGYVSSIHYANLTDMTWSGDGRTLVVSSSDGYCSFVMFEEDELGVPLHKDKIPGVLKQTSTEQNTGVQKTDATVCSVQNVGNTQLSRSSITCTSQMTATEGTNQMTATEGTNQMTATEGTNQMTATEGTNQLAAIKGTNQLAAVKGTDQMTATKGTNQLAAIKGTDQMTATKGTNQLAAVKGTNQTTGVKGTDQMTATEGTNQMTAVKGANQTTATEGTNQTTATEGTNQMTAVKGTDQTTATEGTNQTTATEGTNQMNATEGTNQMTAVKGTDQTTGVDIVDSVSSQIAEANVTDLTASSNQTARLGFQGSSETICNRSPALTIKTELSASLQVKKPRRVNLITLSALSAVSTTTPTVPKTSETKENLFPLPMDQS